MVSKTRTVAALLGLFAVASLVHYVAVGSLPFGTPQLLEEESAETVESEFDA